MRLLLIVLLIGLSYSQQEDETVDRGWPTNSKREFIGSFYPYMTEGFDPDATIPPKAGNLKVCENPTLTNHPKYCSGCKSQAAWLNFDDATPCYIHVKCPKGYVDVDCKTCTDMKKTNQCYGNNTIEYMDDVRCQETANVVRDYKPYSFLRPDVCSINKKQFKACKNPIEDIRIVKFVIIQGLTFFVRELNLRRIEEPKRISSYRCAGDSCLEDSCKTGSCQGDEVFCRNFGCTNSIIDCYCTFTPDNGRMVLMNGAESSLEIDCWGTTYGSVYYEGSPDIYIEDEVCENCKATCEDGKVLISTHNQKMSYLRLCKDPNCMSKKMDSSDFIFTLPKLMTVNPGPVLIEIWFTSLKKSTITAHCSARDMCSLIDCHLCSERWANFRCFESWQWLILIFSSMLILTLLGGCLFAFKMILLTVSWISAPFLWCLRKSGRRIKKNKKYIIARFKTMTEDSSDEESLLNKEEEVVFESIEVPASSKSPSKKLSSRVRKNVLGISLLMLFNLASANQTAIITVSAPSCTYESEGTKTCSITTSTRLSISPVGQSSSFIMEDPVGKPLGSINLLTKSVKLTCLKNSLYFIPEAETACQSHHNCRSRGLCYDTQCEDVLEETKLDVFTSNDVLGYTRCSRKCGCAGCGCGLCSSSCLFWREYFVNRNKEVYEVYDCPQWQYSVELEISKATIGSTSFKKLLISPGISENQWDITFNLNSISVPQQPILNKCFVSKRGMTFMAECNKRGELVAGRIGEIQCPNENAAEKITTDCFAAKVIHTTVSESTVHCSSNLMSPGKLSQDNSLPYQLSGMSLYPSANSVEAEINGLSLFEIQMDFKDFTLTAVSNDNKCFVKFISLIGCYACSAGATLTLEVNTDFGDASAIVKCPSFNIPLSVKEKLTTFTANIKVDKPHLKEECYISCPKGRETFSIEAELHYVSNKDYTLHQETVTTSLGSEGSFNMGSIFGSTWFTYFYAFFIIAAVIGLSAVILYVVCYIKMMKPKIS